MEIELHTLDRPRHSCRVNAGKGDVSVLLYLNNFLLEQTCILTERKSSVLQVDAAELCDKTFHQPCGGYMDGILT